MYDQYKYKMNLQQIKLKNGKVISFKIFENIEEINRGWVVDSIKAYYDNNEVGYLKISYIPHNLFKKYYSSILHYGNNFGGIPYIDNDHLAVPLEQWDEDYLRQLIKKNFYNKYDGIADQLFANILTDDKKTILTNLKKYIKKNRTWKLKQQEFDKFKKFHVDHPLVDYIKVYHPDNDHKFHERNIESLYGQGVGLSLYLAGAEYLKQKNLKLWASGLQSESAKQAWARMEKLGIVEYEDDRKFIKI